MDYATANLLAVRTTPHAPSDDSYEAMIIDYIEAHHIVEYLLLPPDKIAALYANDSYEAMVLEYVEERHIVQYGLLSPEEPAEIHSRDNALALDACSGSSETASTEVVTIENASGLPKVVDHFPEVQEETAAFATCGTPIGMAPPDGLVEGLADIAVD
ncbi:hypothetical protein FOMPIDRAFT_1045979 [Fomitopsis schrenkii]|uniref:Uncharacterized protein n=1 Tax=Fomitopsis schrenkii TaxID=2126942 RepID=S8ENY8_FOMSC|nr:hypothetical protein FOMPIDRAFT_1045979 [Fomitopsis schrenkii]